MSDKEDIIRKLKFSHEMNGNPEMHDVPVSDQMRLLRRELKNASEMIEIRRKKIIELKKENAEQKKQLAYYESENMATSTTSLYNKKLRKFRERRGEDPNGNPGEKAVQPKQPY